MIKLKREQTTRRYSHGIGFGPSCHAGGGFSYGDDTGAGKAYGNRVREHLDKEIEKFLERDTLMIAICSGFQIITSAGILPGALIANDSARYICRWVDLKVESNSPWLRGIETLSLPVAHGEGKYYAPRESLEQLSSGGGSASGGKNNYTVALKYTMGETSKHFDMPTNPNGSLQNIAGITAYGGRVLGLMPHPERAVRFTQLPHWTLLREQYTHQWRFLPQEGPGSQIFRNAVDYFM